MTGKLCRGLGRLAVLALLVGGATACSDDAPPPPHDPGALALVIGGRANMPRPQLIGRAKQWLDEAVLSKDQLFVIGVDGAPTQYFGAPITQECDSATACNGAVGKYEKTVSGMIGKVRAKAPEADTLGAILLAARSVTGATGSGPRRIVVIDNGLQTIGMLRLDANGALGADPVQVAAKLVEGKQLTRLDGTEIMLSGLGTGSGKQPTLEPADLTKLEALWTKVLSAGKAQVTVDPALLPDADPGDGLPEVTVVKPDDGEDVQPRPHCHRIRADKVGFNADEPTFKDRALAVRTLKPIAKDLAAARSAVTVIGTTAYPESKPGNPLSNARATAVAGVLHELGIPKSSLVTGGVGTNFTGYVNPVVNGVQIDTLAQQDRLVIIGPIGGCDE